MINDDNIWENKSGKATKTPISTSIAAAPKKGYLDIDIRRVLSVWPWIIVFGILGYAGGKLYTRYIQTIYLVSTSINIEQKEEVSIGQAIFGSTRDPFNDKIAYFKSPTLALQLVDTLGLQYHAMAKGTFKDKDFYGILDWKVLTTDSNSEVPLVAFSLTPHENDFNYFSGSIKGLARYGQPFQLGAVTLVVNKKKEVNSASPINCSNSNRLEMAFRLSSGITITSSKESNIINISYSDYSSERAIDILNALTGLYNKILSQDKTQSFSQAIDFIDRRIEPLGRELDSIENALAGFKSANRFVGTTANGELYIEKIKEFNKELNEIDIMKGTIQSVERFISNPDLKDENLAMIGIQDQYLQSTLSQYQQLRLERDRLRATQTENHPNLLLVQQHLEELKGNMNLQLQNYKSNLRLAENNYQTNMRQADELLKNTPAQEKELLDKFRMQNIKETLFLTLLQKREEAQIARASVTVNTKVLTPPVKLNAPQKPSKGKILIAALFIGMILPIVFVIIKELMNRKVISKKQLQGMTNIPILAELQQVTNAAKQAFVIDLEKRSMIGEQLRTLRTNLSFYQPESNKCNYILITSSMSGEGKSFLSMNLARSYSIQGKRVALLEFDLRRPKISKVLGLAKDLPGLSAILIGSKTPEEVFIQPEEVGSPEVLHVYPAGAIPPNPQELISGKYMQTLKKYLDDNYDMVVIDTPPYGIVADAQLLGQWADITLVVTRFQQTVTDQIYEINEWQQRNTFNSMAIIFNGVKSKGYYGYKYGYYYHKNKYSAGYYGSDKNS